jgi:type I restriction enzyme S subunit
MIPDGWIIEPLGKYAEFRNGLNFTRSSNGEAVKIIGIPHFWNKEIIDEYSFVETTRISGKLSEQDLLQDGDLLFVRSNGNKNLIGRCLIFRNVSERLSFSGFTIRARVNRKRIVPEYAAYLCRSDVVRPQFLKLGGGTNISNLSQDILQNVVVPLPAIQEQERIVDILSTWDRAIEVTEELISNSEAQKKTLMQELLTGKKRLPGFQGEWNHKALSALGTTYTGLSGKTKADFGSGKPFVPYKNVFSNAVLDMSELEYVRLSDGEKQNMVKSGDIIFTTSSETPEEVGMSSAVLADIGELYLNSFCFGYRIKKQNEFIPSFAKHLFRSSELRRAISSLAQGSTRYNLSKNEFLKISIQLPTRGEQERIVEVLDDVATAHSAEQKKLQKLKAEKSALMQQLLTGKRRVAINKEEAVV